MKKQLFLFLLIMLVAIMIAGCGAEAPAPEAEPAVEAEVPEADPAAEPISISIGHILIDGNPGKTLMEDMAANVAERTEGRVTIELFPNGTLGSEGDMVEQISMGTLDGGLIAVGTLQSFDKRFAIEDLPYMWKDVAYCRDAYKGEFGQYLGEVMTEYGYKTISYQEYGVRHVSNNIRPVTEPEDMAGIRIRVAQTQLRVDAFEQLGAIPTIMAKSELYQSLQQGIVDGTEGPLADLYNQGFYEAQKYCSLTGHFVTTMMLYLRQDIWDQISPEDQAVILEEALVMQDQVCVENDQAETDALALLEAGGVAINDDVDTAAMREEMSPVYEKWADTFGEDLMSIYYDSCGW